MQIHNIHQAVNLTKVYHPVYLPQHNLSNRDTTSCTMETLSIQTTVERRRYHTIIFIPPLPDRHASTALVQDWIRAWHLTHNNDIDSSILTSVTWNGTLSHEQSPAQLKSEVLVWGIPPARGQWMILDLVREVDGEG